MNVKFCCAKEAMTRTLRWLPENPIHVPHKKEQVVIGTKVYVVTQVTTDINSDFTTTPDVRVDLERTY